MPDDDRGLGRVNRLTPYARRLRDRRRKRDRAWREQVFQRMEEAGTR